MIYIGVDPGLNGAIATVRSHGASIIPMPTVKIKRNNKLKTEYDYVHLLHILKEIKKEEHVIYIEKQQTYPDDTNANAHKTGYQYGWLLGACVGLQINVVTVHPRVWQDFCFGNCKTGGTKLMSLNKARELFPEVPLKQDNQRTDKDGFSDSLLIAYYAKMTYEKKGNGFYESQLLYS